TIPVKKQQLQQVGTSWVGNNNFENPFETKLTKKERILLKETFQRLDDPKEIVGMIFLDIVYDIEPDMKKAFSIDRVPKAGMLRMPKFGGHISRFTDLLDKTTNMLGFTENLAGALQLVRKSGRAHARQGYLEANQHNFERNYFEIVMNVFNERFIPFLTGQEELPAPGDKDKKKVRFAQTYTSSQITEVWKKFFNLIAVEMADSFEVERTRQRNAQSQKTLAPHQHIEESERRKKRMQEKQSEIDNTSSFYERKEQEQMLEDPF
ncbi:hypothetical protein Angca_000322, partial [Angiostrongylus cantonensis]